MKTNLKYLLLLAVTAFTFSCDKEDDKGSPNAGTVKGSVSPADGASSIFLIAGADTIKSTPATDGSFEIKGVKAGDYQISAIPNDNFQAPDASAVSVSGGKTTTVPLIDLKRLPVNGYARVIIDDIAYSGSPDFEELGSTGKLSFISNDHLISIVLPYFVQGPGTYTTSTNSEMQFFVADGTDGWSTSNPGGTGTLTITSFNAATKKGIATFSFTATPYNQAKGNKVGINGFLQNVRFN